MSFPRYAEYKDSGTEWIGMVPAHWDVSPFKWQIERNDGGVWGDDPDGEGDTIVLRSTEQTVDGRWRMDDPAPRKLSDSERASALLAEGDLVVTKSSGSSLHIGKTTLVTPEIADMGCCYSNFMQRIRTKPSFSPKLAWYVMNNGITRLQFDLLSSSTTGLANLNGTMIGQVLVAVPPTHEQADIAAFLDRETPKIDGLVEEQKRLIELLKEKRQAVISQAVTKGLDPNVPMKDSGVEWLGDVPAHWELVALKRLGSIRYGIGEPPSYRSEGVPLIRATNVHAGELLDDGLVFVDPDDIPAKRIVWLEAGDIVVVRSGAYTGDSAIIPEGYGPCIAGFDMVFRCAGVNPQFMQYSLLSNYLKDFQIDLLKLRAAQPHLNAEELGSCLVVVPTEEDQAGIVGFLTDQLAWIDSLLLEARMGIEVLRERRSALISAAVTGKIDVRGLGHRPHGDELPSRHDESHDLQCDRSDA